MTVTGMATGTATRLPSVFGGDLPYNDVQAQVGVPNLIADMNSQELAFTVHDGDLKAGKGIPGSVTPTTCSDDLYQYALDHYFSQLRAPAAFTPGDNDWTDCDAAENGPFTLLSVSTTSANFSSTHRSPSAAATNCDRKFRPLRFASASPGWFLASKIGAGPTTASRSQP